MDYPDIVVQGPIGAVLVWSSCHNKIPDTGWLQQLECIFSQFSWLKVQDEGVKGLVSPKASLTGLQMAASSLCPHMAFPLCTCAFQVSL